ncbi:MAG: DUF4398 domain-containing protein [Myxococcales bacterium]|nr:DUF4398 domain-containing protein [Myxococcales bacterium]
MNLLKCPSRAFTRRALCAALLGTALQLTGCGPILTISYIQQTKAELQAARSADAQTLAPYEYTAAVAYLEKTREEHGYADFAVSTDFGEKALKFARSARTKAMEARAEGAQPLPGTAAPRSTVEEVGVMGDEPSLR